MSQNTNPIAISWLEQNLDKINWYYLSSNPAAVHILEKNLNKVDWNMLSLNRAAVHILEKNKDKVRMIAVSNPTAFRLLFQLDYIQMKQQNCDFKEELCKYIFNPERLDKMANNVGIDLHDYLELY